MYDQEKVKERPKSVIPTVTIKPNPGELQRPQTPATPYRIKKNQNRK